MVKGTAIPVTGHGGPLGCETSRLPHFLDSRLTDGFEVVSLTRWPPFTPGRYLVLISVRGWVDHRAIVRPTEKFDDLIGRRTRGLPACSIVPQSTTLPRVEDGCWNNFSNPFCVQIISCSSSSLSARNMNFTESNCWPWDVGATTTPLKQCT
jgi:hypothetical protein